MLPLLDQESTEGSLCNTVTVSYLRINFAHMRALHCGIVHGQCMPFGQANCLWQRYIALPILRMVLRSILELK